MLQTAIRATNGGDWMLLILAVAFFVICVSEYSSSRGILNTWYRYSIKVDTLLKEVKELPKVTLSLYGRMTVYLLTAALVIFSYFKRNDLNYEDDLKGFLLVFVAFIIFHLVKHYLSKLISNLLKIEDLYNALSYLKSYHFGLLGYFIWMILIIFVVSGGGFSYDIFFGIVLVAWVLNAMTIIFRSLTLFGIKPYHYIVYLCTLEILPYLVFIKILIG